MKRLLLTVVGLITLTNVNAQETETPPVKQDNFMISAGYGFPNVIGSILDQLQDELNVETTYFGPAYLKFEYLISPEIGMGLNIAYASLRSEYTDVISTYDYVTDTYHETKYPATLERVTYSVLLRYNYHFSNSERMDAFIGTGLGYRYVRWERDTENPDGTTDFTIPNFLPFGFEATVGMRFLVTKNFGIYAEAGLAKSPIQFGLTLKM